MRAVAELRFFSHFVPDSSCERNGHTCLGVRQTAVDRRTIGPLVVDGDGRMGSL